MSKVMAMRRMPTMKKLQKVNGTEKMFKFKPQIKNNRKINNDHLEAGPSDMSASNIDNYQEGVNEIEMQTRKELQNLIGQCCPTDMDKYEILKKRNQIMNKGRVIDTDYRTADSKIGTSENMCSELEYYTRIVQKRVSPYECDEHGSFDINLMVKDFERSAADQVYPLPHELRTEECLIKTLRYLFINIVTNVPEDTHSQESWYDFVWHRTRSIRKELMQQGINTKEAVQIFEACARFHIFVSYKLCNLNAIAFSQKLNNEHLSKSMHSIRHCYEDLAKENIFCENEVEFACYDLLMNLHDSKVLSKTNRFRREIMESEKMKMTIRLVKEYQSNNYVKFFQIVKNECDFLQSCLLHRYFAEFRLRAMKIILKAYNNCTMHLEYLTDILAIDDYCDTMKLASLYHLEYSKTDPMLLVLGRSDITEIEQEEEYTHDIWIGGKLTGELAAVLLGTTDLENPVFPEMSISFDNNDCYNNDVVIKNYLEGSKMDPEKAKLLNEKRFKEKTIGDCVQVLLNFTTQNVKIDLIKNAFQYEIQVRSCVKAISNEVNIIFEEKRNNFIQDVCKNVYFEEKARTLRNLEIKKKELINLYTEKFSNDLLENVLKSNIKKICEESINTELKYSLDSEIVSITNHLVFYTLYNTREELLKTISLEVYKSDVYEIRKALKRIKKRRINRIVMKCAMFWINTARENIERKRYEAKVLSTLPKRPPKIPTSEVVKKFCMKRGHIYQDENMPFKSQLIFKKRRKSEDIIKELDEIKLHHKLKEFVDKRRKRLALKAFNIWLYNTKLLIKRRQILNIFGVRESKNNKFILDF
uniref:SAC3_GANP domain-containing protein n=1 Tax=Parastrongyloides trichosuri TaxID=131310 RepID=A0A0N4ZYC9_PARTI